MVKRSKCPWSGLDRRSLMAQWWTTSALVARPIWLGLKYRTDSGPNKMVRGHPIDGPHADWFEAILSEFNFMKMKKEKDSTILSGIILSFLHLRHLDLRQLQHECFKHINYLVSINRNCSKMIEVFQKDSKIGDLGRFSGCLLPVGILCRMRRCS